MAKKAVKKVTTKKRNPNDSTFRNIDALKKKVAILGVGQKATAQHFKKTDRRIEEVARLGTADDDDLSDRIDDLEHLTVNVESPKSLLARLNELERTVNKLTERVQYLENPGTMPGERVKDDDTLETEDSDDGNGL